MVETYRMLNIIVLYLTINPIPAVRHHKLDLLIFKSLNISKYYLVLDISHTASANRLLI